MSSFLDIFKDYKGVWWSENISYIGWTFVLQLGFITTIFASEVCAFLDPQNAAGIIGALCAGYGVAAAPILGLVTLQKRKATSIATTRDEKGLDDAKA